MQKLLERNVVPAELRGTWDIDPSHSSVAFSTRHAMVATVRGRFNEFSGSIEVRDDLALSSTDVTIQAASVDTRDAKRDAHLRSPDFLDVEKFPTLRFESTRVEPGNEQDEYRLRGNLTIRGVTREVELDVEFHGTSTDPYGNARAGLSASTTISRKDWGLTWNAALETGGVLVGDKVTLSLDVAVVKRVS